MEPIITVNEYPIGWEWLDNVPLEDFNLRRGIHESFINLRYQTYSNN